jgi:hypothetical protein
MRMGLFGPAEYDLVEIRGLRGGIMSVAPGSGADIFQFVAIHVVDGETRRNGL